MKWLTWAIFFTMAAMGGILSGMASEIVLPFSFDPGQLSYEPIEGYERVILEGAELPEDPPGTPWLPARYINISIPPHAEKVAVHVVAREIVARSGILVYPAQPPVPVSATPPAPAPADALSYSNAERTPALSAILEGIHEMRGQRFASVRLNPVRYTPASRELCLATSLVLSVSYSESAAPDAARAGQSELFARALSRLVVNPPPAPALAAKDARPSGALDYLIVTSAALSNAFQSLATHRASLNGLSTRVMTVESIVNTYSGARPAGGSDAQTSIRNCISNYVTTVGTVYVILGGDNTIVPDRDCSVSCGSYSESTMPTDLYYGGLKGTWDENANGIYGEADYSGSLDEGDLAYDVIVARIPVRTAQQAADYIDKLKAYELSVALLVNTRKLLVGGDQLWNSYTGDNRPADLANDGYSEFRSHEPVSDAEIWGRRACRDGIRAYTANISLSVFLDTLTSWDVGTRGDYLQSSANMVARLNQGWHHLFFNTHGSTTSWGLESGSFSTGSAAALTNRQIFVYTMACLTGGFDSGEPSLSEAFVRNPNGGALVYMGCSRYGWGSPGSYRGGPSLDYAYAFYRQVYSNRQDYIGLAFAEHKLARIASSSYNGADRWIQFGLNLQGDPLVPLYKPDIVLGTDPFWIQAVGLTNSVILRWPDPYSCGLSNQTVHIRRGAASYPVTLEDGTAVYTGTNRVFTDNGQTPGQPCYYTIWASHDGSTFVTPP